MSRKGIPNKDRHKNPRDGTGYPLVFDPKHPLANQQGYVRKNRHVAWAAKLITEKHQKVYCKNNDPNDSRLSNLTIIKPKRIKQV